MNQIVILFISFSCTFLIGVIAGMIVGKIFTEREMANYGEERYEAGCQAGYDDGYADAVDDNDIPDPDDDPNPPDGWIIAS